MRLFAHPNHTFSFKDPSFQKVANSGGHGFKVVTPAFALARQDNSLRTVGATGQATCYFHTFIALNSLNIKLVKGIMVITCRVHVLRMGIPKKTKSQ